MNPTSASAMWARAMRAAGEQATLRRERYGDGPDQVTVYVKAIQNEVRTSDSMSDSGVVTTGRRFLVLFEDISGVDVPIKKDDVLVVGGVEMIVDVVETAARRLQGVQLAYEVEVYGA